MEKETQEQWMSRARCHIVQRDTMPAQVAIEMLTGPKVRLTGRERRMFRDALVTYYLSDLEKKPTEVKLTFKLQHSTFAQINKWLKRVSARYADMQRRYSKRAELVASYQEDSPQRVLGTRQLEAFLEVIGKTAEILEALETEVETRVALASVADKIPTEAVAV